MISKKTKYALKALGYPVLHDINLTILPGQRIGFVGATGAGKSSIMNLVTRFYEVTAGVVRIDSVDVRKWRLEDLRRSVGIVQQDVTPFSGSITDNIRFFQPEITKGGEPTFERVVAAAHLLKRHGVEFTTLTVVNRLNAGYPLEVYRFLTREIGPRTIAQKSAEKPFFATHFTC
jgi:ABC-type multidrug transport system fused ATPase/permease subunit